MAEESRTAKLQGQSAFIDKDSIGIKQKKEPCYLLFHQLGVEKPFM
jgi:hypothetical protein